MAKKAIGRKAKERGDDVRLREIAEKNLGRDIAQQERRAAFDERQNQEFQAWANTPHTVEGLRQELRKENRVSNKSADEQLLITSMMLGRMILTNE